MGKSIAVFGTSSHTGKSTIATAMCRYFSEEGLRVFPFKAFNLSSNSFLYEGYEIGYAQYIQAIACFRKYAAQMNPVLKKYDNGQMDFIIQGLKQEISKENQIDFLREISSEAYTKALRENDLIIVEGSGSCCELNLKSSDVANMHFALKHKIPVVLVGDIENGGIFGSLYGTLQLLSEEERRLVKAIIVNKFSGDMASFEEGKNIIERVCKVKVISVMPFMKLDLPQEDKMQELKPQTIIEETIKEEIKQLTQHFKNHTDLFYLKKLLSEQK